MALRTLLITVGVLGWTVLGSTVRPAAADDLNDVRREIAQLEQQSRLLTIRYQTQASSDEQLAEHRLVDAQVLYNLRDYTRAAIILFDYINRYKDTRGYPEALFYLADSLYHRRDFLSARRYFRQIVDEVKGKYYQEALQRLIELSLRTGDSTNVATDLAALSNIPQHELKPSVPYVRGKYFYFKNQLGDAIAAFRAIPAGQTYYSHSQYFIGAALVKQKDYAGAAKIFQSLLRVQARNKSELHIRDLTHLALGRLAYEKGKVSQAIDAYQKVSRRSKEFDTALYEICWAYIKAGEFQRALRALDLLILAQPDSPFAPEVRVLQGNLLIRLEQWGRATDLFTGARERFLPVHRRMEQLLTEHSDPNVFFDALLARNVGEMTVMIRVPQLAIEWVKENPKVKRALELVKGLRDVQESATDADRLIRRIERTINSPARIRIFPEFASARASSLEIENRLADTRGKILGQERALVGAIATGDERAQLAALASRRDDMQSEISALPTSVEAYEQRRTTVAKQVDALAKQLNKLSVVVDQMNAQLVAAEKYFADTAATTDEAARQSFKNEAQSVRTLIKGMASQIDDLRLLMDEAKDAAGVGGPEEVAERSLKQKYRDVVTEEHRLLASIKTRLSGSAVQQFDGLAAMMSRCDSVYGTVEAFNSKIETEVEGKLGKVRLVIKEEKEAIGKYTGEAREYKAQTDVVAGAITYQGFREVSQRFYEIVVRADVGIIDVAWALKDQKSKEVSRLVQQQKQDLKLLDVEFRELLKEK